MRKHFHEYHLFRLLEEFEQGPLPLDRIFSDYLRKHRAIGARDRRALGEDLFGMVRWKGLLSHLGGLDWPSRYEAWKRIDPLALRESDLPPHTRCSLPEQFFDLLCQHWGEQGAMDFGYLCNEQAPTTVRVNRLKASREQVLEKWTEWGAFPCELSDDGVRLPKRQPLFALPEYRAGWFELQDEGSQIVAAQVAAKPGDLVLDFCAGAGGKSLSIGATMEGRGQLFLHDVRRTALQQARQRLRRAGIQHAQFIMAGERRLRSLRGKMDWVLADVPCTGSGTWRRKPDMKWRFDHGLLDRLRQQQREIVAEAATYLNLGGKLVYATCSVLMEENEEQLHWFQTELGLKVEGKPFLSVPSSGGMDGFFAATLAP